MQQGIAIVGAGIVSPAGIGRKLAFDGLIKGNTCIRQIDRFDISPFKSKLAAHVELEIKTKSIDRHIIFALRAAEEALAEAKIINKKDLCASTGVIFATAIGATEAMEDIYRGKLQPRQDAFRFDTASLIISKTFGLGGPVLNITTGCTASLDALGQAVDLIKLGFCERVLVVTGEAPIVPITLAAFDKIHAVSRCLDPKTASRPFSLGRDGFVLGEGGAAVVLESDTSLKKRDCKIIARALGWSSVSSAFHMTALRTDGQDLIRVINDCLQYSGYGAEAIDGLDLHGTSTFMNDLAEANAVIKVFGDNKKYAVTAQKSINGHALGASNLMEVVNIISSFEYKILPPVPLCVPQDPDCTINLVRLKKEWLGKIVLKISSGFSGIHSAVLLGAP